MEEYEKLYRLGSGGQGKILRVRHKATDVQYACKMILARDNYEMNFALREIKMLMDLQHEHITNYKDFFIHRDRYEDLYVCMVMELCEHGDLSTQIKEVAAHLQPQPRSTHDMQPHVDKTRPFRK